jgi:Fe-S cluster assembly iron-binding protein IscA
MKEMSPVKLAPGTSQAVKTWMSDRGIQGPLRIELCFAGCCDPSLGLSVDEVHESDLVQELDGLTFIVSPETYELTGEVTISYVDDSEQKGFVLTANKSVSEWEGFAVCTIRI